MSTTTLVAGPSSFLHTMSQHTDMRDFLLDAELQLYYDDFINKLKVTTVHQLKYVEDEDLAAIGMTKPEMRRLKKFFRKEYPQGTLGRFKKKISKAIGSEEHRQPTNIPAVFPDRSSPARVVKVPNRHIIPADSITVCKELGVGEFGVVQQGIWTNEDGDRIQVAIKCLAKEHMQNNPMDFLKEACIMHTIDCKHIVRLYGVVLDTDCLMMISELAPLRSLLECLKEPALRCSFPVTTLCDFALQVAVGMNYLEEKRLIHRDLAARNILVFSKNCVKISDFGLSRALGVGKDYYQTNFNVNLKLPIAWCAPECINYLRFTSASDVWAFGVTLWEFFSYGFQPWAALTGQQILDAIDEPNYQRLEQPECCSRDYYSLMLQCWDHEPLKRPTFAQLLQLLPVIKPEQVVVVQDTTGSVKRDHLLLKSDDVITVLDKRPENHPNMWKGVLNNGKTGLFHPSSTAPYVSPSKKFNKLKTSSLPRASGSAGSHYHRPTHRGRVKLKPGMISRPQGDLRHMCHVGRTAGDVFGDVSFMTSELPRQVVQPYKPSDDHESPSSRPSTPSVVDPSDLAPLLPDTASINSPGYNIKPKQQEFSNDAFDTSSMCTAQYPPRELDDHAYTEISDESEKNSPILEEDFHLMPSFVDEVFKALDSSFEQEEQYASRDRDSNSSMTYGAQASVDEVEKLAREIELRKTKDRQAEVKAISPLDEKQLESAIAIVNKYAQKKIDGGEEEESPSRRRKFPLKLKHSPKMERRNFSREVAAIRPDVLQDVMTMDEPAKAAYDALVSSRKLDEKHSKSTRSHTKPKVKSKHRSLSERTPSPEKRVSPPVEMVGKVSKTIELVANGEDTVSLDNGIVFETVKSDLLPIVPENEDLKLVDDAVFDSDAVDQEHVVNVLPLPPRKKTLPLNLKRHERKWPLLYPCNSVPNIPPKPLPRKSLSQRSSSCGDEIDIDAASLARLAGEDRTYTAEELGIYDNRDYFWSDKLDLSTIDEDGNFGLEPLSPDSFSPIPGKYKFGEHVSYEDLLEFALDDPTSSARRAQGKARGIHSDEVRIMQKVLSYQVSGEDCLSALNETNWNIHNAIKYVKLQQLLRAQLSNVETCKKTLLSCNWDVEKAANYLLSLKNTDDVSEC